MNKQKNEESKKLKAALKNEINCNFIDSDEEDDERDHGPSTAANQSAISGGLAQNASAMSAAEKIKKKRGRKPKSFYLQ